MSTVREINHVAEQDAFISNNPSAIIFFGSVRCGHCQDITPVYGQLARQYPGVAFAHVETTKVKCENVDGVPVFVGYKNKRALAPVLGADEPALRRMLQQLS